MWVDVVDEVNDFATTIQARMRELSSLHAKRLMVSFDSDEKAQEEHIQKCTQQLTQLFRRAEGTLKRFAAIGDDPDLSHAETTVRNNMRRALAQKLQGLSGLFRQSQKEYLRRLQAQKTGYRGDSKLGKHMTSFT